MELWLLELFTILEQVENIENLQFEQPAWLWLIMAWPILWLVSSRFTQQDDLSEASANKQLQVKHPFIHKMASGFASVAQAKFDLRLAVFNLLRGFILIALAVALAQPVQKVALASEPESKTVRDIVFVIESSASFLLPDYQIDSKSETRMNVVKQVLDQFIAQLEGNRFSLAIYAENAYTLLPLTHDQNVARLTLKRLKPYLAGRTDGAMGEALGLALKQTDKTTAIKSTSAETQKRVVVLISDGLSQPSRIELTEVVNYAQLLEVPIYTIGVGASNDQADKRLYTGLLYQPLEKESLQALAQQTGGEYYQVGSGQQISEVLQKINQAEGVPYVSPPKPAQKQGLYFYPLALALLIFVIYGLFGLLWPERRHAVNEGAM